MKEIAVQTPRPVKKEREEVLQALEQRFPCSPWSRSRYSNLYFCRPWRTTVQQISTLQPVEDPILQQVDMP